ncbi:sigma-54-dependent Fis family transcriptional regulator [Izhakiella australiensis]|uniref:sigma-54-dependent Fis family transcriptional regulator n=1 Tax=Izhakiella australiensis TaxID=1926881 RepID=UPI002679BBFB
MPHGYLNDILAHNQMLQQIAVPVASQLARRVADSQSVVILSDPDGLVLQTFGNIDAMHKAQRFALAPGNLWSECGRGTNAIGTALAIDGSCEIKGQQHFLTHNQDLYCAAMPLQSPEGRVAGVLDISGPARFPHLNTRQWVEEAVRQIEHRWVKHSLNQNQWLLSLHPQRQPAGEGDEMLLVFADNVLTAANRLAMRTLNITAAQFGLLRFQHLFPAQPQHHTPQPQQLETLTQQRYWFTLQAPQRRYHPVTPAPCSNSGLPVHLQGEGQRILRLLNAGVSLCMTGETGCGKEYLSRALYKQSRWSKGRFVAINCAALPESLIESELFGYQPGAFTGASKQGYIGKIREADGGVLFLDEIGDMPLALQTRLLRVLQEKEVSPLGETRSWPVQFAVICATHRNLHERVAKGEFREDLLYRLQEFTFAIPPLRQWQQLPGFINQLWRDLGAPARGINLSPPLLETLSQHPWPGNIRQLRSLLKVLLALADEGETLGINHLPAEYLPPPVTKNNGALEQNSANYIEETLRHYQGNVSKAAAALGVARSTLYRRAAKAQRTTPR